ncbi:class I SAM-dependent methyltransferase [Thiohalorhabdus sp.]|uniref:class I SAM-dependent methyltransferase n=1 Tax=Thiohalorhabdus sp. TaxID=3094134 RepID=UPI002FC2A3BA
MDPGDYDAWYNSARGSWILAREWRLLRRLLRLGAGHRVLDVGAGTGRFTALFDGAGFIPVGAEPDRSMRAFAARRYPYLGWVGADARALPFRKGSFDGVLAVTSLCFVPEEERSLAEMLRVSRAPVVVGLLNRHSLLHRRKAGRGGYRHARWHSPGEARALAHRACPGCRVRVRTAIWLPGGGLLARLVEGLLSNRLPGGGFLALAIEPS